MNNKPEREPRQSDAVSIPAQPMRPTGTGKKLSAALGDAVPTERKIKFWTAAEIASKTPEEPSWICKPWVTIGAVTELNGPPKEAGKTTLPMYMISSVLDGRPFLGQATMQSPVVYLTEERHATFREVLARPELGRPHDLHVLFRHDTRGFGWPRVVDAAVRKCEEVDARFLVVDTFPSFVELDGDKENNAGDVLQALEPLQEAAARGLGVIVARHERKGGGRVSVSGRGSSAFTAAMDIVMSVRRPDGNGRPTIRHIRALSRFDATPDSLFVELTDAGYVALCDSGAVAVSDAERKIREAAPTCAEDAVTEKALVAESGVKRTTVKEAIQSLQARGALHRIGRGRRGDPYKYWVRPVELVPGGD